MQKRLSCFASLPRAQIQDHHVITQELAVVEISLKDPYTTFAIRISNKALNSKRSTVVPYNRSWRNLPIGCNQMNETKNERKTCNSLLLDELQC